MFDGRGLKRDVDLYRRNQLGDTAFGAGAFPAGTFEAPLLAEMRREFSGINLRVEVSNCTLLLKRLLDEDIEFIVADTQELPSDKALSIEPLRREAAAFYVRAGHPLDGRRSVSLHEAWGYGIASGRVPTSKAAIFAPLLGLATDASLRIALECDDIDVLKKTSLNSDAVLALPYLAVQREIKTGALRRLVVEGLPPMYSATGIVTLRGRTLSPMAKVILDRMRALPLRQEESR